MTTEQEQRYNCNMCGDAHTKDEVILKANTDLLSALHYVQQPDEDESEDSGIRPLHVIEGAILHALDELQLLEVEGFRHPDDEPIAEAAS